MSQTTVVLKVGMSCQGCVGAVQRVLENMEGVESCNIDIKEQKVTVTGNVQPEAVFQNVSKTGKKTSFWEAEPVSSEEKIAEAKPDEVAATEANPTETVPGTKTVEPEPETKATEAAKTVPDIKLAGAGPVTKATEAIIAD